MIGNPRRKLLYLLVFVPFILVCSSLSPEPTATPEPTVTNEPTSTLTPTITHTPTQTATPTITPTATIVPSPTPLAARDVFELLSPKVAFVDAGNQFGSGVLIEGNYLLTNAHVVWPFRSARIVFQDGNEFVDVPVHSWDLMADIALLGPIETEVVGVSMVNGESLDIASDVYLIGYPGEVEEFPTPTITRGLISRIRESSSLDITYFQTDASIAGGQSGGILVSENGDVIGISGFRFTEANFGIVASAADLNPRIEALLAGEDLNGIGDRNLLASETDKSFRENIDNQWDQAIYVIDEEVGTFVEIASIGASVDVAISVMTIYGEQVLFVDDYGGSEEEIAQFEVAIPAPYLVSLFQFGDIRSLVSTNTNVPTHPYDDQDDGISVNVGDTFVGNIDVPEDFDYYVIRLDAGETINIQVESILIDPYVQIAFIGARGRDIIYDDDSGEGIFGLNAEVTFQAPQQGLFQIIIQDSVVSHIGGYTVSISEPYEGAPTPTIPEPTATVQSSTAGEVRLRNSDYVPVSLLIPAGNNWEDFTSECSFILCLEEVTDFAAFYFTEFIVDIDTELETFGLGIEGNLMESFEGTTLISSGLAINELGSEIYRADISSTEFGGTHLSLLIYQYEDVIIYILYILPEAEMDTYNPLVELTFNSIGLGP